MNARVGVVVIGRNEGERLVRCLDALQASANPIVYVDSGSSDRSVAEAEARRAHVVQLDLARPFTAGRARNEGFAALRERTPDVEFVQFIDGDCELAPTWLGDALSFMQERADVAVVCGRRQERFPGGSIYNRLCDLEWNTPVGEADACGGDALMRAAPFVSVEGFSSNLIAGEEPELCNRMRAQGWKIWRLDAEMTLHDAAMHRFGQWWMRGVRSGFGYAQVWAATRNARQPLYRTEVIRAAFWGGAFPLALVALAAIYPLAALALTGIYAVQIMRIAFRRGVTQPHAWAYGLFALLAKFPELQGAMRFWWRTRKGGASSAILYK